MTLFHQEGLECSPDTYHGGPPSPNKLLEKRKEEEEGAVLSASTFDFAAPNRAQMAKRTGDVNVCSSFSIPRLGSFSF